MDQAEYDRRFRSRVPVVSPETVPGVEPRSITVDGATVAPLRITVLNSTPQQLYEREHRQLQSRERIVGYTEGGVPLIRRDRGSDYAGREQWETLMRRCGRLKR